MKTREFYFDLPENLIAQQPPKERGTSRLLILERGSGKTEHTTINKFPGLLEPGSLIVLNNSRVRKARLFGTSENGGSVEFLLLNKTEERTWRVLTSKAKKQRPGKTFTFPGNRSGEIIGIEGPMRIIKFDKEVDDDWLDLHGHIPLPPYIRREDTREDSDRYQTVFGKSTGSAAAPTAGLHFTDEILEKIREGGVEVRFVTLHVGLGTFLPVRAEYLEDHEIHEETYEVPEVTAESINRAKKEGRKIVAVGTTAVRTLESSWKEGRIFPGRSSTNLFIYPGYSFKVVDQLLTNFHTPESSLLMLVSAFAGKEHIFNAYNEAIKREYRFFSYGDAMFIE